MIARCTLANSSSGPWLIRTRAAFCVVGLTCAGIGSEESRQPAAKVIASFRSSLFISRPHSEIIQLIAREIRLREGRAPAGDAHAFWSYGIGGLGTGCTPQTSDPHGGRGGVGIRLPLP